MFNEIINSTLSDCWCGDRGFFSERNLKMLSNADIRFTIPVPSSIRWDKDLIKEHRDSLIHPSYFIDESKTKIRQNRLRKEGARASVEKDTRKALQSYRECGGVELAFDDIKNLFDRNRLRGYNEHPVKGKIFVNIFAQIILSKLRRTVDAIPEKERSFLSETDMLDKVETYTRIHFSGKCRNLFSAPTKAQREIFDLLIIKYEYKGEELNAEPKPPQEM